MISIYRWSKIGTRLLYKIRHHKGHGIHSPFVFHLINNVIEEKLPYYCYKDLARYLSLYGSKGLALQKENLLAFRFINYFNAKNILEIGSGLGINTLCLTSPSKKIQCTCIESSKERSQTAITLYENYPRNIILRSAISEISLTNLDCIYINLDLFHSFTHDELDRLVDMCHEKSFIMVEGIRNSKKQNQLWRRLSENKQRTAELDLFDIGILFFDKQLSRWKYQISF